MGFLFTYLMCFFGAIIVQWIYARKMVHKMITFTAYAGAAILVFFWIVDSLLIYGVLDKYLISLNALPGVHLPEQNTGLYYYYNCLLLGYVDLKIPVQNASGYKIFAIVIQTTYISIYKNGQSWGKLLYGKRHHQWGIVPLLKPLKAPKNWREMERKWKEEALKREAKQEEIDKFISEGLELAEKLDLKKKHKRISSLKSA